MKTVAIVRAIWVTSVFVTSALVSQGLMDSRNPPPMLSQQGEGSPSDAGSEPPRGYAIAGTGPVVAWSSWDAAM
jgi:hypothetical protein